MLISVIKWEQMLAAGWFSSQAHGFLGFSRFSLWSSNALLWMLRESRLPIF